MLHATAVGGGKDIRMLLSAVMRTSHTESPRKASATAFQFARTALPSRKGTGGSTGFTSAHAATASAPNGAAPTSVARAARWKLLHTRHRYL